jgi:hypothetical protein
MFVKCFVLCVVLAMASCNNELSCGERLSSNVPTSVTTTWHTKADCANGVNISVPFLSSKAGYAIIIKNIHLMNSTEKIDMTDGDLFTINVQQPMEGNAAKWETIMTCSSQYMNICLDRASKGNAAHITIESVNGTDPKGISVYFTVQEMASAEFAGYQNCKCAGAPAVTQHGQYIPVELPGNDSNVQWSSTEAPCMGSLCIYKISTDLDAHIKIAFVNTDSLTNTSYVRCSVIGKQFDVNNDNTVVDTPSFTSNYTKPFVTTIFSSALSMSVFVDYYSFDDFKKQNLLQQTAFVMNVSTPLVPTEVIVEATVHFTAKNSDKVQTIAPSMKTYPDHIAYPNQRVQWKLNSTVDDKDGKQYGIGYAVNKECSGLMKGSNYLIVRETCDDGKNEIAINSCADLSETAVNSKRRSLCIWWFRENATLPTGDWVLTVSLIPSGAMSVSSMGSLLVVAVIALFVKQ